MPCPSHREAEPSQDTQLDGWALVDAYLARDYEAAHVIVSHGCAACLAGFTAALLAEYLGQVLGSGAPGAVRHLRQQVLSAGGD